MKKMIKKENVKKFGFILLSSFVLALSMKLFIQPNGFLAGGVSGLTVLISRYVSIVLNKRELESLLYSILYFLFNIPIFIFGYKKIGKTFIGYSIINIALFSLFVSIIPLSWVEVFQLNQIKEPLTQAILAGILSGIGGVIAFSHGFSQGGTDIISVYLSRSKGKGIGSYNFFMNSAILVIGGVVFRDYASLIYTVIYFFINSLVVNNLYISHKKVLVEVVSEKSDELAQNLMNISHHGCTIVDAVGAYSKNNKKILRIVVSADQIRSVCEIVKTIDEKSFTTLIDVRQVNGKFYIPPMK